MRLVVSIAAALIVAAGAPADTIHIPADYPTIQAGIKAAAPGDEVVVADGTWSGPGNIDLDPLGKAITVRSENGPEACLIDCKFKGRGFNIHTGEGPDTRIQGFSITSGSAAQGAGFFISGGSPTIDSCWVDSGSASAGGGLFCVNGSPDLLSCEFTYNGASPGNGSGACFMNSNASATDCEFSGNEGSGSGGGVYAQGGSLTLTSCRSEFNISNLGAGVYSSGCELSLVQCSVRGNGGGQTSGIHCDGGDVDLTSCTITGNGDYGGGVRLNSVSARITGCSITNNDDDKDQGHGGGVCLTASSALLTGCTISGNTVGYEFLGRGGGVYISPDSVAFVIDCRVEGNYAFDHFYSGGEGGGIYTAGNAAFVGCTIRSNGAVSGAGVWASGSPTFDACLLATNNAAYFGGGTLLKGDASFTRCTFDGNHAWLVQPIGKGGGAAFIQGNPTFDRCLFTGNASDGQLGNGGDGGGAIWSDGQAQFVNCIFTGNADVGAGFGGAMVTSGRDTIVNSVFYGNALIGGQGGAIYGRTPGTTLTNSIVRSNGPVPLAGPLSVFYSDVQGGTDGPGNFDADPLFVDPVSGDFRIAPGSPCIDSGDSGAVPPGINTDYAGAARRVDVAASPDQGKGPPPIVDVGAYEFPATIKPCQTEQLLAADGQAGDEFRYAAFGPGILAVGAYSADAQGADAGAVYIYERDGAFRWAFQTKLVAPGGHAGDFFGARVYLDADRLIAGSSRDDQQGESAGAAYIFRNDGQSWIPEAKLLPDDPQAAAQFGYAVAISGARALCGSWKHDVDGVSNAGAAYIFRRDGDQWVQEARLVASDPLPFASLGWAVDLRGDVALVAAVGANGNRGLAYIFRRVGGQWVQEARLEAPDGAPGDKFAYAVALRADRAVLGAPWHDHGAEDCGAAYIFDRKPDGWALNTELNGSLGIAGSLAGSSVAIEGDLVAVGAPGADDRGIDSGAAAVFRSSGDQWAELAHLAGDGSAAGDLMGRPVALGEGFLAVGAPLHDGPGGPDQGTVYLFALPGCPCYADMTEDGALDLFDFLAFQNAFAAQDPAADCDHSGLFDLFDFLCYQNAFVVGCS